MSTIGARACAAVCTVLAMAAPRQVSAQTPRITFRAATSTVLATDRAAGLAVADLNQDGHLDLAISGRPAPFTVPTTVSLFAGSGAGVFTDVGGFRFQNATALAAADFNGDGHQDLVVTQDLANKTGIYGDQVCGSVVGVAIFLGPGMSTARCIATVARALAVRAADFDGDGRADIAVVSANAQGMVIYSELNFVSNGVRVTNVAGSAVAATSLANPADLNGDGKLDLIVGHSTGLKVFLGTGNAAFTAGATVASNSVRAVAVGLFDADTRPDVAWIESGTNGRLRVGLGAGDGTFATQVISTLGAGLNDIAIADLDRDGRADLAVAHGSAGTIRIWFGDGTGAFVAHPPLAISLRPSLLTVRDFNEDGKLDFGIVDESVGGLNAVLWVALQQGSNPPDTTPPTVSLTSPLPGSLVSGIVAVSAAASDNVGVARVDFFANGAPIGASAGPDYRVAWNTTLWPTGAVTLSAGAVDAAGNVSGWATVPVTVVPTPNVLVSHATVTFGKQRVGMAGGAAQVVHLQNNGPGVLNFISFNGQTPTASFSAGDFPITTNCPVAGGLAAGTGCDFSIRFSPTASGQRTATLTIGDNALDNPQTIALAGTGFVVDEQTVGEALGAGGIRVGDLQNPDGGWYFKAGSADCAGSCPNTIGVTGLGLIAAYNRTGDPEALAGAVKAGNLLATKYTEALTQTPAGLPKLQDVEFLKALADASGQTRYLETAASWFQVLINQYPTGASRVDDLLARRERQGRRSLAAWDVASLIRAAKAAGRADYASAAATRIREREAIWKDFDPSHRSEVCGNACGPPGNRWPFDDTLLGTGSLLWAIHDIPGFATSIAEYASFLRAQQDPSGSWNGGDLQITAYAALGLAALGGSGNDAALRSAAAAFIESQRPDGGWPFSLRASGGAEYTEVDAEITRALLPVFNTPTGTNISIAPSQVSNITFSSVASAGGTTVVAIDPTTAAGLTGAGEMVGGIGYDVQTNATFAGNITVCFSLVWITDQATFDAVRILHGEDGAAIDRTILTGPLAPDFGMRRMCALVSSLSPFIVARSNHAPVAQPARYTMNKGHELTGTLGATDSDGDRVTFELVKAPSQGSVVIDDATGAFTYTPKRKAEGRDRFTFRVSDGSLTSGEAAITVTVKEIKKSKDRKANTDRETPDKRQDR